MRPSCLRERGAGSERDGLRMRTLKNRGVVTGLYIPLAIWILYRRDGLLSWIHLL